MKDQLCFFFTSVDEAFKDNEGGRPDNPMLACKQYLLSRTEGTL